MSDRTNFEETLNTRDSHAPQVVSQAAAQIPAGFWRRFVAIFLDGLILMAVQYPIKFIGDSQGSSETLAFSIYTGIFGFFITFLYTGFFLTTKAATPGKMAMSLKVVKADGAIIDFKTVFIREIIGKTLSGITLGIGYLMAAFRQDKKALHDLMAETQVILVNK